MPDYLNTVSQGHMDPRFREGDEMGFRNPET